MGEITQPNKLLSKSRACIVYYFPGRRDWRSGGGVFVGHRDGPADRGGAGVADSPAGEQALSQLLRREPAVGNGLRDGRLCSEQQGKKGGRD